MTTDAGTSRFTTGATGRRTTADEPEGDGWRGPEYDDSGWWEARKIADWGAAP
ncbi:hypothetical protein [Streptomyces oryzae]|uniref:hypothetical protein n=1 Tax=Streptomyces oryzae TaxID=1434886 RepID=UPI0027DD55E6|nr:hypothetical protein [Streptomyces oryzae]